MLCGVGKALGKGRKAEWVCGVGVGEYLKGRKVVKNYYACEVIEGNDVDFNNEDAIAIYQFDSIEARDKWVNAGNPYRGKGYRCAIMGDETTTLEWLIAHDAVVEGYEYDYQ